MTGSCYLLLRGKSLGEASPFLEGIPFPKGDFRRRQLWVFSSQHSGQRPECPVMESYVLTWVFKYGETYGLTVMWIWARHLGLWDSLTEFWRFNEIYCLVGCGPWGREESDTTERLPFRFSLPRIGEGNGNPLQCSCLENPRDGGVWWAAVYGVTQSRTRLKRLSSSSSKVKVQVMLNKCYCHYFTEIYENYWAFCPLHSYIWWLTYFLHLVLSQFLFFLNSILYWSIAS